MKFLKKNTKVIVRSRISKKELIRPISDYVDGKLYKNLGVYIDLHIRDFKRGGFFYSYNEIIHNPVIFDLFIEKLVHPEYKISYEDIDKPIWIIKSYKKGTPLFLVLEGHSIPNPALTFLNQILSTYGYINKKPKYEAKSIKKNLSPHDR
ncbi:hypothetical protein [Lysinibacillus irui]|uniref:Uncharacterized protein n=1 Tax=Lysinibacillus irui TaxID=2998077 RepID=A0AAJ5UWD2_9BACI|nr:hypothetical protein [Lysinibacillus irui]WDV09313.1 hypothetical protein OU989_22580 [Lysinibacillus irui]